MFLYRWGPRAEVEVDKKELLAFVAEVCRMEFPPPLVSSFKIFFFLFRHMEVTLVSGKGSSETS